MDTESVEYDGLMEIRCTQHLADVRAFAASVGASDNLEESLQRLVTLARNSGGRVVLMHDFAPHSFTWHLGRDDTLLLVGGLIHQGPGVVHDGSAPVYTVSIAEPSDEHRWLLHT